MSDNGRYNKDADTRRGEAPASATEPESRLSLIEGRLASLEERERRRDMQAYGLRSVIIQLLGHFEEAFGLPRTIPSRKNRSD